MSDKHRKPRHVHLKSRGVSLPRLDVLLVDPLEHVAGDRRVEERVEADEHVGLDHVHAVQVLAEDRSQAHLSQLLQLVCEIMCQWGTWGALGTHLW